MKIAKKVLAVAMAVAMIACFAAMAFAAPADAKAALTVSEVEDGWWIINPDEDVEYEESETTVILDASKHLQWKGKNRL